MYLVYYNYSNAGPECHARVAFVTTRISRHYLSLTLSQTSPCFYVPAVSHLKTLREKEKLLIMSDFSFPHSVFHSFGEHSAIFIKFEIVVCKLFQFGPVRNMVVWERVKYMNSTEIIIVKGKFALD